MKLRDQIICVADGYCSETGMSRSRLSTLILNAGHRLDKISLNGDLNTESFERAMLWLSENWPENTDWPEGVERPSLQVSLTEGSLPRKSADGQSASQEVGATQ